MDEYRKSVFLAHAINGHGLEIVSVKALEVRMHLYALEAKFHDLMNIGSGGRAVEVHGAKACHCTVAFMDRTGDEMVDG